MGATSKALALIVLLALGLAGCEQEQKAGPVEEVLQPVKAVTVAYTTAIPTGSLIGEVEPQIKSDLGFRLSGKMVERLVDVGDLVKLGQPLARLDVVPMQNSLKQAESAVAAAIAEKVNAEQTAERQRQLLAKDVTTRATYDAAMAQADVARAKLNNAQAALADAKDSVSYATLNAASDGVITAVGGEVGQVVSAGQMVVQVARLDLRDAVLQVPEAVLQIAPRNLPVNVSLLANPEIKTTGRVREISPVADPVTRTFRVKVSLIHPGEAFRFGSTVNASVDLPSAKTVVLPLTALYNAGDKPAVWVVDPATSSVKLVPVVVSRYDSDTFSVTSGLAAGDKVVVAGVRRLRPDMKVSLDGA